MVFTIKVRGLKGKHKSRESHYRKKSHVSFRIQMYLRDRLPGQM